jgi:hypothetical protein
MMALTQVAVIPIPFSSYPTIGVAMKRIKGVQMFECPTMYVVESVTESSTHSARVEIKTYVQ